MKSCVCILLSAVVVVSLAQRGGGPRGGGPGRAMPQSCVNEAGQPGDQSSQEECIATFMTTHRVDLTAVNQCLQSCELGGQQGQGGQGGRQGGQGGRQGGQGGRQGGQGGRQGGQGGQESTQDRAAMKCVQEATQPAMEACTSQAAARSGVQLAAQPERGQQRGVQGGQRQGGQRQGGQRQGGQRQGGQRQGGQPSGNRGGRGGAHLERLLEQAQKCGVLSCALFAAGPEVTNLDGAKALMVQARTQCGGGRVGSQSTECERDRETLKAAMETCRTQNQAAFRAAATTCGLSAEAQANMQQRGRG